MNQRSRGLTWLDSKDRKQQEWARKYLQGKRKIDPRNLPSTSELLQIGEDLESSGEGILILVQMRAAWRQVKCNASDKTRKTYAFKLKIDAKKELARLAEESKITAGNMLSRLISDGANAHTELKKQRDEFKEEAKRLRQRNNAAMDLLEFTVAALCRTEILLHDSHSTVTITQDQQHRIEKLVKEVVTEAGTDIAASTDKTNELKLRIPGRLSKAMKEEQRVCRLIAGRPTKNTSQTRLIDLQPVTYSKPLSQQPPQTKTKPNPAGTLNSTNPPLGQSTSEAIGTAPIENASPHSTTEAQIQPPQTATWDQHGRYKIYASIGKDGVASAFIKMHPAKTGNTTLNNHLENEAVEAPSDENTSPHLAANRPPQSAQTATPSPPSRYKPGQTLGEFLFEQEKEALDLEAKVRG